MPGQAGIQLRISAARQLFNERRKQADMNCVDFVVSRLCEIREDLYERGSEPRELRMHPDAMRYFNWEICKDIEGAGDIPIEIASSIIINGMPVVLDENCRFPCVIDSENRRYLL
ncbi:valine--tRNA ligase [Caballeronia pedi]|uniref:valine--tRNA ligase n=1 Tax=Caballeronia pedi TaxID=1777141 RepID=UPI001177701E|nr:valine--tRNA ligase [Caballeronia pedi]